MRVYVIAALAWLACAQQPPPYVDPQLAGIYTHIGQHAARVDPMLQQVRVADWVAKGAPETYVAQLSGTREQIHDIQTEMAELAQHPDRMQDSMKALFRVQAFHRSLTSLMGGLRKYQNPPLADLIESVAAEDQADLDALQNHILDLANEKEQAFQVVNNEAQRCRATLSRQPADSPKTTRRTN